MRQVLLEAIHLASNGIVEDMDNGDGYLSLKISQDSIVDKATLDRCFALGALCAIFLVKTHSAPDPISPFLLQAVTGGLFSIVDLKWVQSVSPAAAAVLELLPTNADEPIPHHPSLESLVRSRFPGTTVSCFKPQDHSGCLRILTFSSFQQYKKCTLPIRTNSDVWFSTGLYWEHARRYWKIH